MPRYINEDDFCEYIRKNTTPSGAEWFISKIKDMPSADVVEVVRCEDCEYSRYDELNVRDERLWCCVNIIDLPVLHNDFCSKGRRKNPKLKKCFNISKEVAEKLLEDTEV
jgi:hypothetical protein